MYELVCLMCFVLLFVINIVGSLFDFSLRCVVSGVGENVCRKMINNENVNLILK